MNEDNNWRSSRRFVTKQINYRNPYFQRETPVEKKKRHEKLTASIFILLFAVILYFILFSKYFRISELNVSNANSQNINYVEAITDDYLNMKYALIFPKDNWFLLSPSSLEAYIEREVVNKFSLASVEVDKKFPNKVNVVFKERTAELLIENQNSTYLLDNQGVVISEYYNITETEGDAQDETRLPLIKINDEILVSIGKNSLPAEMVNAIINAGEILPRRLPDIKIDHFSIIPRECEPSEKPAEQISLDNSGLENLNVNSNSEPEPEIECDKFDLNEFSVVTYDGFSIYFTVRDDITYQVNNLYLAVNEKIKTRLDQLNYIDLRFLPKIYYK